GFPPYAYATYLSKWAETRRPLKPLVADGMPDVRIPPAWKLPDTHGRDFWITGASQIVPGYSRAVSIRGAKPTIEAFAERYGANPASAPVFGSPVSAVKLGVNFVQRLCDPSDPMRLYILENRLPFVLVGNYSSAGKIKDSYKTVQKAFGDLWLGVVSGENSYLNMPFWPAAPVADRSSFKSSRHSWLLSQGREEWRLRLSEDWNTDIADPFGKLILASSVGTLPLVHRLGEAGCQVLACETAAAMPYIPLQAAFVRGAARQYGRRWLWYFGASFGDAIRTFITEPPYFLESDGLRVDERNDVVGPSLAHIRRTLLHAYMQGASFFHPEQGYDLFDTSGALNPMGWPFDEMTRLAVRRPDRGVIATPVAILLDHAHGWDKYTYKGMRLFQERPLERSDRMINELFNVVYFPFPRNEGDPVDDLNVPWPHGFFGDIFDVLVTSPTRLEAVASYKLVFCAGDVRLDARAADTLKKYVAEGGVLAINVEQVRGFFDEDFLGTSLGHEWKEADTVECVRDGEKLAGTIFKYLTVKPVTADVIARAGSDPLALVNRFGKGRVVLTTASYLIGLDGVAMPYLAHLMLELTSGLLPVEVRGDCHHSVNLREDGIVVMIENNNGIVKRSHQPAVMDESQASEVTLRLELEPMKTEEWLGEQPQSWEYPNEWLLDHTRPIRIGWRKTLAGYETTVKLGPGEIRIIFIRTK
ncbi:MAG: hypothetical protein JXO72_14970, partial [Vicinamibacteria bacterium]|nr:hypothetical protein [Vicinamibacteria bacterium]